LCALKLGVEQFFCIATYDRNEWT